MQTVYIYLNILSLIIVFVLGILSYKNKEEKISKYFMISMIFMIIWTLGTILELVSSGLIMKVIFRNFVQFGMAFVSIANYWFVVSYTGLEKKIYRIILWVFVSLNILAMVLLATDPIHHLLRSKVSLVNTHGFNDLVISSTYLGMFFVLIRFILFAFATVLLFVYLKKTFKSMKKQVFMISTGFLLALIVLLLKQYWLEGLGFSVPMSVILCFPYIFIGIGVFKYDFLSISPLANDWVINSLEDGIIVLSKDGKVLEANNSAKLFLDKYRDKLDRERLNEIYKSSEDSFHRLNFETQEGKKFFDAKVHHLIMDNGQKRGTVAIIKDVTPHVNKQLELKAKAELDPLTKIYNREAFERKISKIVNKKISYLILDIDKFKVINDKFGHPTGDAVIVGIVSAIKNSIRSNDFIGRIGGDEFAVVLEESTYENCVDICKRIFESIKVQKFDVGIELPPINVSIGVYTGFDIKNVPYKKIYEKADFALYQAKISEENFVILEEIKK